MISASSAERPFAPAPRERSKPPWRRSAAVANAMFPPVPTTHGGVDGRSKMRGSSPTNWQWPNPWSSSGETGPNAAATGALEKAATTA